MTANETSNKLSQEEADLLRRVVLEKYAKRAVLLRALHQYNKLQEQGFPTQAPSNPFGANDDDDDDDWSITTREDDNPDENWYIKTENRVITIYCERVESTTSRNDDCSTVNTTPSISSSKCLSDGTAKADKTASVTEAPSASSCDHSRGTSVLDSAKVKTSKSNNYPKKDVIRSTTALIDKVLKDHKEEDEKPKLRTGKTVRDNSPPASNVMIHSVNQNNAISAPSAEEGKFRSTRDKIAFWNSLAQKEEPNDMKKAISKIADKSRSQKFVSATTKKCSGNANSKKDSKVAVLNETQLHDQ